jgi:hypothetical protein
MLSRLFSQRNNLLVYGSKATYLTLSQNSQLGKQLVNTNYLPKYTNNIDTLYRLNTVSAKPPAALWGAKANYSTTSRVLSNNSSNYSADSNSNDTTNSNYNGSTSDIFNTILFGSVMLTGVTAVGIGAAMIIGFEIEDYRNKKQWARLEKECVEKEKIKAKKIQYYKDRLTKEIQTPQLCKEAVEYDGTLIEYIDNVTIKLYKIARHTNKKNNYYSISLNHVKKQTPELCMYAVKEDWTMLRYVTIQTVELCVEAIKQNTDARKFIKHYTPEIYLQLIKCNPMLLNEVDLNMKTQQLCEIAVNLDPCALQYVPSIFQTKTMCINAVSKFDYLLNHIDSDILKSNYDEIMRAAKNSKQSICEQHCHIVPIIKHTGGTFF